jgi:hypothetical protein
MHVQLLYVFPYHIIHLLEAPVAVLKAPLPAILLSSLNLTPKPTVGSGGKDKSKTRAAAVIHTLWWRDNAENEGSNLLQRLTKYQMMKPLSIITV